MNMKQISIPYLKTILRFVEKNKKAYDTFGYNEPKYMLKEDTAFIDENDLWQFHNVQKYIKENTIHFRPYNRIPFNPMRNVRTQSYGYGKQEEL